jgi:hypothetical protein
MQSSATSSTVVAMPAGARNAPSARRTTHPGSDARAKNIAI